jgi:hypothetical protein
MGAAVRAERDPPPLKRARFGPRHEGPPGEDPAAVPCIPRAHQIGDEKDGGGKPVRRENGDGELGVVAVAVIEGDDDRPRRREGAIGPVSQVLGQAEHVIPSPCEPPHLFGEVPHRHDIS